MDLEPGDHTVKRRTFLQTSALGAAATAATVGGSKWLVPPTATSAGSPVRVSVFGARRSGRDELVEAFEARAGTGVPVQWRWSAGQAGPWMADDIRVSARYVPSADGMELDFLPATYSSHGYGFATYWRGRCNAAITGIEQYAVLVHTGKAYRTGSKGLNLRSMNEAGVRPLFPISPNGSAGINSWLLPVAATHLRLPGKPGGNFGLTDDSGIDCLSELGDLVTTALNVAVVHDLVARRHYADLLDPSKPHAIAMWGSPERLSDLARMVADGATALSAVRAVPLQRFLPTSAPSLFPTVALQIGRDVVSPAAAPAADALAELLPSGVVGSVLAHTVPTGRGPLDPTGGPVPLAAQAHSFDHYRNVRHLDHLTDDGFLAHLFIDLATGLNQQDQGADRRQAVAWAAGRADQRWHQFEAVLAVCPREPHSAPAPAFGRTRPPSRRRSLATA
jgi:hypothetical protein